MSDDETWKGGDASDSGPPGDFGTPAVGSGQDANLAFSVDAVFRGGVKVLQEQPAMALLGGVNFFALSFLTGMVGGVVQLAVAGMVVGGELDQQVADAVGQIASAGVQLIAWPFNQLVLAGLMVAGGTYVRSGEANIPALYASVGPAVRALVAGVVAGLALSGVALVSLVPAGAAAALMVQGGSDPMTILGVALLLCLPVFPVVIWVGLGLGLAPYAAVLDDLGPVEAVQQSWEAARGARLTLFVTNFAFAILAMFSVCMCSLPLIALMPIQVMGYSAAWLRYARATQETDAWPFFGG